MKSEAVQGLPILLVSVIALGCARDRPSAGFDAAVGVDAMTPGVDAAYSVDARLPPDSAAPDSAETDAHMPVTSFASEALTGPTYQGSVNNSVACSMGYPTRGFAPVDGSGARHPLFLYFVGTAFVATDPSAAHDGAAPMAVTEAMARRGFVSLSVAYDNGAIAWLSDHQSQLACLFGGGNGESLIAKACALPNVDCDLGIATWGHSQGGYAAAMAYNVERRVRAAWATGYGGDGAAMLDKTRLRVVNGEADTSNGMATTLNTITGLTASMCPDPDQCLRADGSGWIIVRVADLAMPSTSSADHCWFDRTSCSASTITLEPNWVDRASTKAFALELNADWVAATTLR